jgi:hypothetical protein
MREQERRRHNDAAFLFCKSNIPKRNTRQLNARYLDAVIAGLPDGAG